MGRGNVHRDRQRQFGAQADEPWGDYAPPPLSFESSSRPQAARETEARVKGFVANSDRGQKDARVARKRLCGEPLELLRER
jgi:cold shock protein